MRNRVGVLTTARLAAVAAVLLGSVALVSAPKPAYSKREKAFFADPSIVAFVRPGLVVQIESAAIAADGTITAKFKITDPKGLPLDRTGTYTPGAVNTSFIAATILAGQQQYTAYTTRLQTSPITGVSATQAGADAGGTYQQVGEGEYVYTFHTKAPATIDRNATHSIGVYSSRNLTEFDLGTSFDDNVFNFVPNGTPVVTTRDVVRTTSCNQCHDPLSAHGGARKSTELCILCHTPQTTDPDTGNTVDFKVMVHKIHQGEGLPSVEAGVPYQIIGFGQGVNDYSSVVFPADVRTCEKCHDPNSGAAQANAYLANPTRDACGSCHDNVNFATGENHSADSLPEISDRQCANCHTPEGELDFDPSIKGAHVIPRLSKSLPGTVFTLIRVDNGAAGKQPAVTFSVKDKSGAPIPLSAMTRLGLDLAGPTTDYAGVISENALGAAANADGSYTYTFTAAIPATATGTFSIGIEGYRNVKLLPGTKKEVTVRDAGANQVLSFSVDGSPVAERRKVVAIENCNQCHSSLSVHGDNRNQTVLCVLCHNPNGTDVARRPAEENPPETIDFRTMIHKIHTGEELNSEFTIYGFGGSKNDFTDVRFPGDRRNCEKCHVPGSQQLPLNDNLLSVVTPRGYTNPTPPTAAACLACHTDKPAASHALSNTNTLGEACAVCHGPDGEFSIDKVHAR
ncbi:MAG: OmcA/MtrC family decaheme c-type cytochrome [Candidatus Solibacter usitatus]|nr:OmcA/MtrC family decaheme c-type cytochrome [Candidatus Solibacter usitatus]